MFLPVKDSLMQGPPGRPRSGREWGIQAGGTAGKCWSSTLEESSISEEVVEFASVDLAVTQSKTLRVKTDFLEIQITRIHSC
ncbi:hypothetical protein H6P81_014154 [Aristolochia fimbriata]|uniref:Uncharacterized protein n=1 Tax=Aristolochia fimbriata TaxID=158543 RepID=A0AAV7EHW3_ARIFI|nr:hypothetical protein H6P81_014154 [Aristolochia fimbriata]